MGGREGGGAVMVTFLDTMPPETRVLFLADALELGGVDLTRDPDAEAEAARIRRLPRRQREREWAVLAMRLLKIKGRVEERGRTKCFGSPLEDAFPVPGNGAGRGT